MNHSIAVLNETLVRVLGHSLWQATVVSVVAWCMLRLLPAKFANLRYSVATAGLVAVVLSAFATWSVLRLGSIDGSETEATVSKPPGIRLIARGNSEPVIRDFFTPSQRDHSDESKRQTPERSLTTSATESPSLTASRQRLLAQWLSGLWLCGAVFLLGRGAFGQVTVRAWMAESVVNRLDLSSLETLVKELRERFGLRRAVRIIVSDRLTVPAVVGTLWPVILVPPAMLTGIPVDQWRIIIAHELAHVRRWDAIVNLAQMVVESLLFFNPAVWWLSRQVRVEREACCDALAVKVCGQPLSVAWALVNVAGAVAGGNGVERRRGTMPNLQSSLLAFAEPSKDGELTDRVRRLVEPDRAPRSKISWATLGAVLAAFVATAVLAQRGTDLAVRAAAKWMSPKDRVEKFVQLEAERNGTIIPLAEDPQDVVPGGSNPSTDGQSASPQAGKIAVQLIVKTDDGSEITRELSLHSISSTGHNSTGTSLAPPQVAAPEYRTTLHLPPCQLRIGGSQPGRAVAISQIVTLMPTDREKTIELVLTKGSPLEAVVKNESGESIPFAWLQRTAQVTVRGSSSGCSRTDKQADEHGRLCFQHIGNAEYSLNAQAPGYQRLEFKKEFREPQAFTAESPLVITLKAARPTSVRVIDTATGQSIKQARLRIVHRQTKSGAMTYGYSRRWDSPDRWTDYGITDDDGRAPLDQLEDGATYSFAIVANGYGVGLLETRSGQVEQTVKMSPPVKISGRVTGSIERLQKQTDPKKTGYQLPVYSRLGEHFGDNSWADVDAEGRFMLSGCSVGERLTLMLPDERRDIVLKESLANMEFIVNPAKGPTSVPMRDVVIRLTGTATEAPARGTLYVAWQHPTIQTAQIQNGPLPLRGNEIRLSIPVGAQLSFHEQDLAGYRIAEQNQIEIESGSEPQVVEAAATPVGGIYGSIARADGSPAEQGFVSVFATKLPPGEKDHGRIDQSASFGGAQFLRKVPLGGRYRILVREQSPTGYVWAVSDEVAINASSPFDKIDIQLPVGRDVRMKVIDDAEQPVVGQSVEMEVSFSLKDSSAGFAFRLGSETDASGIATFQGLSGDQNLGPITLTLTAVTKPNPFVGTATRVDVNRPIELRLKKGVGASGVLIDSQTNRPIPDAGIRIIPRNFALATFKDQVTTKTDAEGRFHFEGLEPIEYTGYVDGTSPKGTVLEPYGNGGLRFHYPNGAKQLGLAAGPDETPARWEVVIHPNSPLKALE